TFEESLTAFWLSSKNLKNSLAHHAYLKKIKKPQELMQKVFRLNEAPNLPDQFKLLGLKNILLLGYGLEGQTTEKYLKKNYPGLKIGLADQKDGLDYLAKQKHFELAIKTPGINRKEMAIPYTTATNLFFSQANQMIIGITGTKGKSTTASLIYQILKTAGLKTELVGNIGQPMLKVLLKKTDPKAILVIELSSYQLDDIKYSPHIAVAINLFPDHMNYHQSKEKYYLAKKNITNFQNSGDFFIYNRHFSQLKNWAKKTQARAVAFNREKVKNYQTKILGRHNQENIQAAIAVTKLFKIPDQTINQALKEFKPLPHRLQFIGEYRKIKFYDDAISTTPESTIMAIKTLKNIGTILLGGQDRGYNFKELEKIVRQYKIKNIVLFPNSGQRMFKNKKGLNILTTTKMSDAVRFAYQNTPPGKICLLSTASPSYSLWRNFEDKGDQFQAWAKKYSRE
ncbi:MAG: UDP-N-acetylmuramoyl-L-alanine--D-glutamate ligase, partial [bacterium]